MCLCKKVNIYLYSSISQNLFKSLGEDEWIPVEFGRVDIFDHFRCVTYTNNEAGHQRGASTCDAVPINNEIMLYITVMCMYTEL